MTLESKVTVNYSNYVHLACNTNSSYIFDAGGLFSTMFANLAQCLPMACILDAGGSYLAQ